MSLTNIEQYELITQLGVTGAALQGAFQLETEPEAEAFVRSVNGNTPDENGDCVVIVDKPWTYRAQTGSVQSNTYQPAYRDHNVLIVFSSVERVNINLVTTFLYRESPIYEFKVVNELGRIYFGGTGIVPSGGAFLRKGQVGTVNRTPTGWVVSGCNETLPQDDGT